MPTTVSSETPSGGHHFLFTSPDGQFMRCNSSQLAEGVDIRGDGGYIVAPGSWCLGKRYGPMRGTKVVERPRWMSEAIRRRSITEGIVSRDPVKLATLEGRLGQALGYLDANNYVTWIKVGMALKKIPDDIMRIPGIKTDDDAFSWWVTWSRHQTLYNLSDHEYAMKWATFKGSTHPAG